MMKSSQKGFTLIELLVVIAIIGILAAVVLASLGSARSKGNDAAVKDNMSSIRSQAELVSTSNNNSYAAVCGNGVTIDPQVNQMLTNLTNSDTYATAATQKNGAGATNKVTCNSTTSAWSVQAPLSTGGFWCTDSTGFAGTTSVAFAAASNTCF